MTISEYTIKRNYPAPRINLKAGEPMAYKTLAAGSVIKGFLYDNKDPNASIASDLKMIITEDKLYALPLNVTEFKQDVSIDGKAVAPRPSSITESKSKGGYDLPEEIRERFNALKTTDIVGNIVQQSRSSANGLLIGAVGGLATALIFKKPVMFSMLSGAFIGGYIGYRCNKKTSVTTD